LDLIGHKLKVILQRAEVRDYQDIAALLRSGTSLDLGLAAAAALFAPGFPVVESVKALGYFRDLAGPLSLSEPDQTLLMAAIGRLPTDLPVLPLLGRELWPSMQ
jgi:hypothetical protein